MELNLTRPLLFFDIESTGLNIASDCIIELSFVKILPGGEQRIKTWKLLPWDYETRSQKPIAPSASAVNGVKDEDLVKAFEKEAQAALPYGFAYCSIEDIRRAVVTWIAMAMSDGDYSKREKLCIESLRNHFAKLKVMRLQTEEYRWLELAPSFDHAYGGGSARGSVELVSKDFVTRVESLVSQYGDKAAAAKELELLIGA